jgi:hypothetical protein
VSLGALNGVRTARTPEEFSAALASIMATEPLGMVAWTMYA